VTGNVVRGWKMQSLGKDGLQSGRTKIIVRGSTTIGLQRGQMRAEVREEKKKYGARGVW